MVTYKWGRDGNPGDHLSWGRGGGVSWGFGGEAPGCSQRQLLTARIKVDHIVKARNKLAKGEMGDLYATRIGQSNTRASFGQRRANLDEECCSDGSFE